MNDEFTYIETNETPICDFSKVSTDELWFAVMNEEMNDK